MSFARTAALFVSVFAVLTSIQTKATGQSLTTASKGAEFSAFGGYMPAQTDYGSHALTGLGAGVDFTIFPRFLLAPSLEVRGGLAKGSDATEKTFAVGPRVQVDYHERFHPYADFLIGVGTITFHPDPAPDYTSDRSKIYSYGGGVNIDVTRHFGAKLDFQQQSWNLGANRGANVQGNFTLAPRTFLVGVTYTIPFRKLNRQGDFR